MILQLAAVNNPDPASKIETNDNVDESLVGSNSTDLADLDELGQVIESIEQKSRSYINLHIFHKISSLLIIS